MPRPTRRMEALPTLTNGHHPEDQTDLEDLEGRTDPVNPVEPVDPKDLLPHFKHTTLDPRAREGNRVGKCAGDPFF